MDMSVPFPAETFVRHLARLERSGFSNPWAGDGPAETRRAALARHLACPQARVLLISEFAKDADAGATGIPLVSEYAAVSGMVPAVRRVAYEGLGRTPRFEALSSEIWRGLNFLGMTGQAITFAAVPLVPDGRAVQHESAYVDLWRWVNAIIEWHRGIRVVTVGARADFVAQAMQVPHHAILPPLPGGPGVVDQLISLLRSG